MTGQSLTRSLADRRRRLSEGRRRIGIRCLEHRGNGFHSHRYFLHVPLAIDDNAARIGCGVRKRDAEHPGSPQTSCHVTHFWDVFCD